MNKEKCARERDGEIERKRTRWSYRLCVYAWASASRFISHGCCISTALDAAAIQNPYKRCMYVCMYAYIAEEVEK